MCPALARPDSPWPQAGPSDDEGDLMPLQLLVFLSVLLWGTTPLFEKLALRGASPLIVLLVRTAFIATCVAGVAAATGQLGQALRMDARTLLFTLLSGLTGGVLGLTVYLYALRSGQASVVVPLTSTYPLVTVVLSVLVLGEPVTATKALGAALIVAGVMLLA
jgi:transporter family protein